MTTFTTEDRELVELQIKTYSQQSCALTHPLNAANQAQDKSNSKAILNYRIEDVSEDLEN